MSAVAATTAANEASLYQPSLLRALDQLLEVLPVSDGMHATLGFLPYDPRTLLSYALLLGYVDLQNGRWHCSDHGQRLLTAKDRYRAAVIDITIRFQPSWIRVASQGRSAVARYRPDLPLVHCFQETGLMTATDDETVAFWDRMGGLSRNRLDDARTATGRDGERLTMAYEYQRTGQSPQWRALDLAGLGYDILSQLGAADSAPLYLEVKATSLPWSSGRLHLTLHEWRFLSGHPNDSAIDCWSLTDAGIKHHRANPDAVAVHLPANQGSGAWELAIIPFAALTDSPETVTQ